MRFPHYNKFEISSHNWGSGKIDNIIEVLEGVIQHSFDNLDNNLIPQINVVIQNCSPNSPLYIRSEDWGGLIFLNVQGERWKEYIGQFSHELCHHITWCEDPRTKYGWLDETLAELFSGYSFVKMADDWKEHPPTFIKKDYWQEVKSCGDFILNYSKIQTSFSGWFRERVQELQKNRYKRDENKVIASEINNCIKKHEDLWKAFQYLKFIENSDHLCWEQYFCAWKRKLPENLHEEFKLILELFDVKSV